MDWISLMILGVIVGILAIFITEPSGMPQLLSLFLGIVGVLAGGFLTKVTGFSAAGPATMYFMGTVFAICLLAGGTFAYILTE